MITLTVYPCPPAPRRWEVFHPARRDTVICRAPTPDEAAAIAAQEWAIEVGGYTVTTTTTTGDTQP